MNEKYFYTHKDIDIYVNSEGEFRGVVPDKGVLKSATCSGLCKKIDDALKVKYRKVKVVRLRHGHAARIGYASSPSPRSQYNIGDYFRAKLGNDKGYSEHTDLYILDDESKLDGIRKAEADYNRALEALKVEMLRLRGVLKPLTAEDMIEGGGE